MEITNYRFADLIDFDQTQKLLQHFAESVGVAAAIVDREGTFMITSSRWQRICTEFHRANPKTARRCIESDTLLANALQEGKFFSLYRCRNGLTDAASPIIIEGHHLANAFIGQFFIEKPDIEFFRLQAKEFGYDESAYLEALAEVPTVSKEILPAILSFLTSFAVMLGGLTLKQLRQKAAEEELRKAQKELEAQNEMLRRYEMIAEQSRDIILFMRRDDGRILEANLAATKSYGYSHDELLKMKVHDLLARERVEHIAARMEEADKRGILFETVHRHRDGGTFPVEVSSRGATVGDTRTIISVVRDITERKLMEEELRRSHDELELHVRERTASLTEALEKLERMNQELAEFAHVASHDLQEPLRKIQAFGDRLRSKCCEKLDDTEKHYLARMEAAANRMQRLIRDLLNLSRIATGCEPSETIDLEEIAQEVAQIFELQLRSSGGRLEIGGLPKLEADATQMKQLLQNLIGNALKFQKQGAKPHVRVHCTSRGEKDCQICVEDNGIGFDDKYRDRIFAPFQRLHGNSAYEGTGMGLAICRKIVERHGGQIAARNRPEGGSVFVITLPLKQPPGVNA
ncbi:MAG: PocR ligand-binding domain-containing protein [Syntrophobacter sp.]